MLQRSVTVNELRQSEFMESWKSNSTCSVPLPMKSSISTELIFFHWAATWKKESGKEGIEKEKKSDVK